MLFISRGDIRRVFRLMWLIVCSLQPASAPRPARSRGEAGWYDVPPAIRHQKRKIRHPYPPHTPRRYRQDNFKRCSPFRLFGWLAEWRFRPLYTSPQGTNPFVAKYDFVNRPSIFKRGFLWDKKIWTYPGPGFVETVSFEPEWLSETQIRFIYDDKNDEYDEEFIITIPY